MTNGRVEMETQNREKVFVFALAQTAGFCWGVKRAIQGAEGKRKNKNEELYVLGRLVHNADVVSRLQKKGIHIIEKIEEAQGKPLVITAHGRDPKDIRRARALTRVLDMTCPIVKDQHKAAVDLKNAGYKMVLIGMRSKSHPEVEGTVGVLEGEVTVVESVTDVDRIQYSPATPIGVIAQTTFNEDLVFKILGEIKKRYSDVKYEPTICDDISKKQDELRMRGGEYDTVIVVGDKKSANSTHLAEIAERELEKKTLFILNETELNLSALRGSKKIFVTAGASTPSFSIEGVINKLEGIGGRMEESLGPEN
jgi:4-hydroxy-3-methylbut-2-enyl diphosphate reductase